MTRQKSRAVDRRRAALGIREQIGDVLLDRRGDERRDDRGHAGLGQRADDPRPVGVIRRREVGAVRPVDLCIDQAGSEDAVVLQIGFAWWFSVAAGGNLAVDDVNPPGPGTVGDAMD